MALLRVWYAGGLRCTWSLITIAGRTPGDGVQLRGQPLFNYTSTHGSAVAIASNRAKGYFSCVR